jgi:hypothetical protein
VDELTIGRHEFRVRDLSDAPSYTSFDHNSSAEPAAFLTVSEGARVSESSEARCMTSRSAAKRSVLYDVPFFLCPRVDGLTNVNPEKALIAFADRSFLSPVPACQSWGRILRSFEVTELSYMEADLDRFVELVLVTTIEVTIENVGFRPFQSSDLVQSIFVVSIIAGVFHLSSV